jgi:hypothetical protein
MRTEKIQLKTKVNIFKIKDGDKLKNALSDLEKIKRPEVWDFDNIKDLAYFHEENKNTICYIGLKWICAILSDHNEEGVDYDELFINECALGTTGGHTDASTALNVETYRKNISSASYSANKLYVTSWYLPAECSGNFREEGIFIKGLGTVNSGYPLSIVDLTAAQGDKTTADGILVERRIIFD